jgi:hypothetical protein
MKKQKKIVYFVFIYFSPQFHDYNLVSSLQLPNGLGRGEGRIMRPPMTRRLYPEASCTSVSEETPFN